MAGGRIVICCLIAVATTWSASSFQEGVPITYSDPLNRTEEDFLRPVIRMDSGTPFVKLEPCMDTGGGDAESLVVLLVEDRIYSGIETSLNTFKSDLELEGYSVEIWLIENQSVFEIRLNLQLEWNLNDLVGAICIGDIPAPWGEFDYMYDFGEYPMDLYLMDMNGTWSDSDVDGIFDGRTTNATPDIWVGRITPTYLTFGASVELINNYFEKNHAYRIGSLLIPERALGYEEAFGGSGYLDLVYDDVTTVTSASGTAGDFRSKLIDGYEMVHLICHSSPWGSSFHDGGPGGTFNNFEVSPLNPKAFFYTLSCCSNGRWTEIDNLGNSYIWSDDYGLISLAQTKLDFSNDFYEYYSTLSSGKCIGDAFIPWLANNMELEDGAVLFGDPTLRPRRSLWPTFCEAGHVEEITVPVTSPWQTFPITENMHTQGNTDAWTDPGTGNVFAVSGCSDPYRADVIATHTDNDTWISPLEVCEHQYWDWHPAIGGDGDGNIWTAWQSMSTVFDYSNYDILISHWSGSDWEPAQQLTDGFPFEVEPALAGGDGSAWLVWQLWENTDPDIEGRYWNGSSWETAVHIAAADDPERYPDIDYGGGRFGLVYYALRSDNWVICFREASGSSFGAEQIISGLDDESRYPSISCDGEYFWVVWQNQNCEILSTHETGSGWTTPEVISSAEKAVRPEIAVDDSGVAVAAWVAEKTAVQCTWNTGSGWTTPETAISASAIDDISMAFDGSGTLRAVYGRRDADYEWDLWAATPVPGGISTEPVSESTGMSGLRITVEGPNPFFNAVSLMIDSSEKVDIRIFNSAGRLIHENTISPGLYTWNGLGSEGNPIPAGVYFVQVTGGERTANCRMIKLP